MVTANQYGIRHSVLHATVKSLVKTPLSETLMHALLYTCYSQRALLAHCMHTMNSWYTSVHVACALCTHEHSRDDEMQLIIRQLINVTKFTGWKYGHVC